MSEFFNICQKSIASLGLSPICLSCTQNVLKNTTEKAIFELTLPPYKSVKFTDIHPLVIMNAETGTLELIFKTKIAVNEHILENINLINEKAGTGRAFIKDNELFIKSLAFLPYEYSLDENLSLVRRYLISFVDTIVLFYKSEVVDLK